jgi:hypothetical protein
LREILRSTLGDRKSTSFYRVLQTLFSLPSLSSHYDVAYDRELYKVRTILVQFVKLIELFVSLAIHKLFSAETGDCFVE